MKYATACRLHTSNHWRSAFAAGFACDAAAASAGCTGSTAIAAASSAALPGVATGAASAAGPSLSAGWAGAGATGSGTGTAASENEYMPCRYIAIDLIVRAVMRKQASVSAWRCFAHLVGPQLPDRLALLRHQTRPRHPLQIDNKAMGQRSDENELITRSHAIGSVALTSVFTCYEPSELGGREHGGKVASCRQSVSELRACHALQQQH